MNAALCLWYGISVAAPDQLEDLRVAIGKVIEKSVSLMVFV